MVVWYCMYVYSRTFILWMAFLHHKCLFQFIVSVSVQWIPIVTAQCLWLVAQLTLLPVGCLSPSDFKEPQTEPLLGERIVFWPLLFSCASSSISVSTVEMFRLFLGKVPRSTCCCVTRFLVTVSTLCVQYFFIYFTVFEIIHERCTQREPWALRRNCHQSYWTSRSWWNLTKSQRISWSRCGTTTWDKLSLLSWKSFLYSNDYKYMFSCFYRQWAELNVQTNISSLWMCWSIPVR